ncbi:hypothetical protein L3Q82_018342, partial [Scortum barcoo]
TSSEHLPDGGGAAGRASSSSAASGNGTWDGAGGLDQITVAEEEEEAEAGEEEEDGVYVIEYSNPEEEGESYQFTIPLRPPRPRHEARQKRKLAAEEEAKREEVVSNKCVLALGENYSDVMQMNSGSGKRLVCSLCPPPGRFFKRGSGLAVHLKQMHHMEGKKTFYCVSCQQTVRTQVELDAHTRRHANQDAVFTCLLCSAGAAEQSGFQGSRLQVTRVTYLADQFRHVVGVIRHYYCAKCQIYEMTERGLSVHIKNHDKKKKKEQQEEEEEELGENHLQTFGVSVSDDNSATDDSDF